MTWLGTHESGFETFPDGTINAKQLRCVLTLSDPTYGNICNTGHGVNQPLVQLTDEIVEVQCRISKFGGRIGTERPCVLWLTSEGQQVASAVYVGVKPQDRRVETYWIEPKQLELRSFKYEPITTTHEGMWSLGGEGAVPKTRQWIKDNYVNQEDN